MVIPKDLGNGQGRKYRGRLLLFPDLSEYLEDDQTSNPSPNCGEGIALTNQHEIFGEFLEDLTILSTRPSELLFSSAVSS